MRASGTCSYHCDLKGMKNVIVKQLNIKIRSKKGNFLSETVQEVRKMAGRY
jgi:hypothetical protein